MSESEMEMVWIGYYTNSRKIYHTDPECDTLNKGSPTKVTKSYCSDRELCTICRDGAEAYRNAAKTVPERDCPYCGTTVKKLPYHLVKCDEKGQLE